MLDMLHGMVKDKAYAQHRDEFTEAMLNKYGGDFEREWDKYNKDTLGKNDGKEQYRNNWIDGQLRNLLFEGTEEDFKRSNYWMGAKEFYLKDNEIKKTFSQLKDYLSTGE